MMLAALVSASLAALAGPFFAISAVTARRPFSFLVRGSLERACVLAGAAIAASCACAGAFFLMEPIVNKDQDMLACTRIFFLVVPPLVGLAPWAAGELLSGPSRRQEESLAAALAASYLAAALAFFVAIDAGHAVAFAAAASSATVLGAAGYMAARGRAVK